MHNNFNEICVFFFSLTLFFFFYSYIHLDWQTTCNEQILLHCWHNDIGARDCSSNGKNETNCSRVSCFIATVLKNPKFKTIVSQLKWINVIMHSVLFCIFSTKYSYILSIHIARPTYYENLNHVWDERYIFLPIQNPM